MGQKRGLLDLAAIKRHVFTTALAPVVHVRGFLATNQVRLSLLVRAHHGALQKLRGMIGRDLDETLMIVPRLPVISASKK